MLNKYIKYNTNIIFIEMYYILLYIHTFIYNIVSLIA